MHYKKYISIFFLLITFSFTAYAENSTRADGYTIHHNAFTTDTLSPAIAKHYGITRSRYRGMINISLIKEKDGTTGKPTAAKTQVILKRLTGQKEDVRMKEIKEGEAVYYIGTFGIVNGEHLRFTVQVTPSGSENTYQAKLEQQFFSN